MSDTAEERGEKAARETIAKLDRMMAPDLVDEIARLRRTLAYYAAPDHYDGGDVPGHIYVLDDGGCYAREALGLPQRLTDGTRFDIELKCRRMMEHPQQEPS